MARYQPHKKVKSIGFNNKGFNDDSTDGISRHLPIIYNDFNNEYKRNKHLNSLFKKDIHVKPATPVVPDIPVEPISISEFHKQNEIGIDKAYDSPNTGYLYNNGDTLYIGGTYSGRDVYDDAKVPFGLTRYSKIYIDADKLLKEHPEIKNLSGHSLGGSVALELEKLSWTIQSNNI
jgi:hypothetical protein